MHLSTLATGLFAASAAAAAVPDLCLRGDDIEITQYRLQTNDNVIENLSFHISFPCSGDIVCSTKEPITLLPSAIIRCKDGRTDESGFRFAVSGLDTGAPDDTSLSQYRLTVYSGSESNSRYGMVIVPTQCRQPGGFAAHEYICEQNAEKPVFLELKG